MAGVKKTAAAGRAKPPAASKAQPPAKKAKSASDRAAGSKAPPVDKQDVPKRRREAVEVPLEEDRASEADGSEASDVDFDDLLEKSPSEASQAPSGSEDDDGEDAREAGAAAEMPPAKRQARSKLVVCKYDANVASHEECICDNCLGSSQDFS